MIEISAKQIWEIKETDLTPCSGCSEMIISARHVLSLEMKCGTKTDIIPTNTQLCQSCYEAIQPNEAE